MFDRARRGAEQFFELARADAPEVAHDFHGLVGASDAVITLTGLDELNIVISLYANTRNVSQVVTKLSHA